MRTHRPPSLQDPGRGAHGALRVHRGVLQSPPAPFLDRLPLPARLRAPAPRRVRPAPPPPPPPPPPTRPGPRPVPAPRQPAGVLAAIKDKPFGRPKGAVLDGRSARRPHRHAGRDGRMVPWGAEQKNDPIEEEPLTPETT